MNCTNCGLELRPDERFCPDCGSPAPVMQQSQNYGGQPQAQAYNAQTKPKTFCPDCGTELYTSDAFCPTCGRNLGAPVMQNRPPVQPQKKSQAGLIATIIALVVLATVAIGIVIFALAGGNESDSDNGYTEEQVTPTPAPPVFTGVSATSTRDSDTDTTNNEIVYYYPSYAVDGLMYTAWTPDRKIDSVPVLTLSADTRQYVTGIRMTNGYCKSQKTYTRNRRITKAAIMYEGGEKIVTFGIDNFGNLIDIYLDEPVYTSYISIKVLETYYGDWKDIAISEVEVF